MARMKTRRPERTPGNSAPASASRRGFLKGSAAAGLGGAAALVGLGAGEASAQSIRWDHEADVVVIGSGGAGMPAAIAARDQGASVLVVEQNFDVGGQAINSGGIIQLGCGNRYQKEAGIEDSPDRFFREWTDKDHPVARYSDRAIVRKFADEALATFAFLEENGVKWTRLGNFGTLKGLGVFTVRRIVLAAPAPLDEQPTRTNNGGSGFLRGLEKSARRKGVKFLMQHRVMKIHREKHDSGRVLGVTAVEVDKMVEPVGRTVNIRARRGVIITTGGYQGNVEFRRLFDPRLTEEYSPDFRASNPKYGDAELAALSIGASLWTTQLQTNEYGTQLEDGNVLGVHVNGGPRFPPDSEWFKRQRAVGLSVKDEQDLILVKEHGKRFWDETHTDKEGRANAIRLKTGYHPFEYFAAAMAWTGDPNKLDGGGPIWAIFDSAAVAREEWTIAPPWVEERYCFKGDTLEELASKLTGNPYQWRPMPGKALRETVERYNSFVDTGVDLDFKKPKPLYKIEKPPFYAAWGTPCPDECQAGLRINTNAQVVDMKGKVIPGLYAAGDSASGMLFHGLGKASLFGRVAGMHAGKQHT